MEGEKVVSCEGVAGASQGLDADDQTKREYRDSQNLHGDPQLGGDKDKDMELISNALSGAFVDKQGGEGMWGHPRGMKTKMISKILNLGTIFLGEVWGPLKPKRWGET